QASGQYEFVTDAYSKGRRITGVCMPDGSVHINTQHIVAVGDVSAIDDLRYTLVHEGTHADVVNDQRVGNLLSRLIVATMRDGGLMDEQLAVIRRIGGTNEYDKYKAQLEAQGINPNHMIGDEFLAHSIEAIERGIPIEQITNNKTLQTYISELYGYRQGNPGRGTSERQQNDAVGKGKRIQEGAGTDGNTAGTDSGRGPAESLNGNTKQSLQNELNDNASKENKSTTEEEIKPIGSGVFGEIYDQFKGKVKDAIDFLKNKKSGEALNVLHHKDIDGGISLVWGDEKSGLAHILKKHPKLADNLQELLDGMNISSQSDNRIVLESESHKAVVSKMKGLEPTSNWLLTAYEKKKPVSVSSSDIETEPKGKRNDTASPQNELSNGKVNKDSEIKQANVGENAKIDDWGEKIAGARKDALKELAQTVDDINEQELIEKPLGKVWKRPDYAKMVEKGQITPEDALVLESITRALLSIPKPKLQRYGSNYKLKGWVNMVLKTLEAIKNYSKGNADAKQNVVDMLANGTNNISVMYHILKELGYPETKLSKFSIPEIRHIADSNSGDVYYTGSRRFSDSKDAMKEAVRITMVQLGYDNVEYSPEDFIITENSRFLSEDTGKYTVTWMKSGRTKSVNEITVGSKEEADSFVEQKKKQGIYAVVTPQKTGKRIIDSYGIKARDPFTRERVNLKWEEPTFETKEEADAYIKSNIAELGEKANEAIAPLHQKESNTSPADRIKLYIDWDRKTGKYDIWMPLGSNTALGNMMTVFSCDTRKEAYDWANDIKNRERLAEQLAKAKESMKKENGFTPEKPRVGNDWRKGKDISEREFGETFGFRGVQFGNWANQKDRQNALNEAYDALMDMADVLGVSPKALSLNGELGMAFGARGVGGFAAHYESGQVVINITKTRGAGSLAHEWWHALDNYFGRNGWSSSTFITDISRATNNKVRDVVARAFFDIVKAVNNSDYNKRNAGSDYWGSNIEETARLFAEWIKAEIESKGNNNSFLAHGIKSEDEYRQMMYNVQKTLNPYEKMTFDEFKSKPSSLSGYRYPTKQEMEELSPLMQNLFDVMQEKVENGKAVLYQRGKYFNNIQSESNNPSSNLASEVAVQLVQDAGIEVVADKAEMERVLNE
ncbi:MAG: hypothetical protein HUJ98_06975, partial [Bacteroidaceae bacterium]|nr:hypothetical protein [Bacteroidaceae bacterium]